MLIELVCSKWKKVFLALFLIMMYMQNTMKKVQVYIRPCVWADGLQEPLKYWAILKHGAGLLQMIAVGRALFGGEVAYVMLAPLSLVFIVTMGWLLVAGFRVPLASSATRTKE